MSWQGYAFSAYLSEFLGVKFLFCLSLVNLPWVTDSIIRKPALSLLIHRHLYHGETMSYKYFASSAYFF